MRSSVILSLCPLLVVLIFGVQDSFAESSQLLQHVEVTMRAVGDRVLMNAGDSTSRVLPVIRVDNQYEIRFASEFDILPDELASTVDSVIISNQVSKAYIVEVKQCGSKKVVYSYEVEPTVEKDVLSCKSRALPKDCYSVHITLLDMPVNPSDHSNPGESKAAFFVIPFFLLLGIALFFYKDGVTQKTDNGGISIGAYRFDPSAMTLSYDENKTELTGKESELLFLLYSSVNETVERDLILEKVWGDQGDYIGRTLDVFVSKLRKKLESDTRVKIKNIRGVGYKLVVT